MSRSCSAEPSGMCKPLTILLASRLTDISPPVFASNTRDAHGAGPDALPEVSYGRGQEPPWRRGCKSPLI